MNHRVRESQHESLALTERTLLNRNALALLASGLQTGEGEFIFRRWLNDIAL
jgi:hypothetical protein